MVELVEAAIFRDERDDANDEAKGLIKGDSQNGDSKSDEFILENA